MKGDFSRPSVGGQNHYVGVLHQQGRVWLDSDWNADTLQRLGLLQREATDVIGVCGVPDPGSAFRISPNPSPTAAPDDFLIAGGPGAAGRCYVHGVQCQLDASTSYLSQPDLLDPPRIPMPTATADVNAVVYLEVWQRLVTYLEDEALREIALGGPDTATRLKTIAQVKVAIVPGSVAGPTITCENAGRFLPATGDGRLTTLQPQDSLPEDLCRLPDPALFTGRENHLYRVEIHDGGDVIGSPAGLTVRVRLAQDATAGTSTLVLATALGAAQAEAVTRWGTLTLVDDDGRSERVVVASVSTDRSVLTLDSPLDDAFTTARNAAVLGVARFKWSRDNAAFAVRVSAVSSDRRTLSVESLGRDKATALRQGDLVEISDDASDLGPARGHLTFLVADPDPDQFTVVVADALPGTFATGPGAGRHLVLRRWDGQGTAKSTFGETATPDLNLGDGVRIQFGGSDLRAGDYWQFAARSTDGSVEALTDAPPAGIVRERCPLAIVRWTLGAGTPASSSSAVAFQVVQDCRRLFNPLSALPRAEDGMHVTRVATIDPRGERGAPLANDSDLLATDLLPGLVVECDAEVEPATINRATCQLSVEIPGQIPPAVPTAAPLVGYQTVILAGNVGAVGNSIVWQPTAGTARALEDLPLFKLPGDRGILAHLALKGNFIWASKNPALFLDGDAFALPEAGTVTTSLRLPTGDRRRGGTFEMWFWLISRPVVLTGFSLTPAQITAGDVATGTITLSDVAPPGGVVVVVTSSNAGIGGVSSANVTVPAGQTTATFQVTGNAAGTVTITAFLGDVTLTAPLTVVNRPILLANLQLNIVRIPVGGTATGTLTLSQVAPAPGVTVALTSSVPGVISGLPASLRITGSATGTFVVTGQTPGTTAIQGVLGASRAATLTVFQPKGKEIKEKDKEVAKDKEIAKEVAKEIEIVEPVRPGPIPTPGPRLEPGPTRQPGSTSPRAPGPPEQEPAPARRATRKRGARRPSGEAPTGRAQDTAGNGRAFIRPEERPRIG
jgi:uncharacterized protein DUF6519